MPTATESARIVETLNADLALEHGAIFQYIVHAGQLRGTPLAEAVMEFAREEMWHLEWLAEAIVERGGEPGLGRSEVFTSESVLESMGADVGAEDAALEHYAKTLGIIGDADDGLTRLIERIVDDEHHHRENFVALENQVAADGEAAYALSPVVSPVEIPLAAQALVLEYEGLLRYMWSKFGCTEPEEAETFFELAVDEMRHGSWATGYLVRDRQTAGGARARGSCAPSAPFRRGSRACGRVRATRGRHVRPAVPDRRRPGTEGRLRARHLPARLPPLRPRPHERRADGRAELTSQPSSPAPAAQ